VTILETERVATLLRKRQAELTRSLRSRDEIVIERASDALDEVQLKGEREFAVRNLDRESNALGQIHRALSRIGSGTYGMCLHCEEEISSRRLAAVPWAAFCIRCQEKVDRREIEIDESVALLTPAA
jgi:DnaK suppressor protein